MFFISCRCSSIGLEQINLRAEIQGDPLTAFSRSLGLVCPTLLPGQMTDIGEALRGWYHFFFFCEKVLCWAGPRHYRSFTTTLRHTTLGRTALAKWSVRHRDLYLTAHNTHNRQTSVSPMGFDPAILASEWPQTHALDRAASGIGKWYYRANKTTYF